jgi:hypothetical protein
MRTTTSRGTDPTRLERLLRHHRELPHRITRPIPPPLG